MKSTRLFLLLVLTGMVLLLIQSVTVVVASDSVVGDDDDEDAADLDAAVDAGDVEIHSDDDGDDATPNNDDNEESAATAVNVVEPQDLDDSLDLEHEEELEEDEPEDEIMDQQEEEEEDEEEVANEREGSGVVKTVLGSALSNSDKNSNDSSAAAVANHSNNLKQLLLTVATRHHRSMIATSLILFAFRREIYNTLFYFASQPYVNMETGATVRRLAMPSLSNLLQILVVAHLVWKLVAVPYFKRHISLQQNGNFTPASGAASSSSYAGGNGGVFEDDDMDQDQDDGALTSTLVSLLLLIFGGGRGGIGGMNPIAVTLILSKLFSSNSGSGGMRRNPTYIPPIEQHYTFERINERYIKDGMALQKAMATTSGTRSSSRGGLTGLWSSSPSSQEASHNNETINSTSLRRPWQALNPTVFLKSQQSHALQQQQQAPSEPYNATVIVMDLTSAHVTQTNILRDQVSFLLSEYRKKALLQTATHGSHDPDTSSSNDSCCEIEVVVLLESPGGSASDYALASQQILRLRREPGITVTIAVDKVAASGGYMIACTSSPGRLLAAPFALLGSIGVVGQTINVHKALEGWGVQPLVFRGGRDKAPVGLLGEVTQQGLAKVQDMVDDTHRAFKRFVAESRPAVASRIEQVATGDVWLGYDALEQGLIDRIVTSDEYIGEKMAQGARVLKLVLFKRGSFPFQRPSYTSEPVSMATAIGSRSSLKNLGGQVVLQLASSIRSILERFAVSLLDQQPQPGIIGSDGYVDLVQDNQPYMIRPAPTAAATMATSSSSLP